MHLQEKISALGKNRNHKYIRGAEYVRVDEKIDGSQITFGVFDGQLEIRSKSRDIDLANPVGMFERAVDSIQERRHLLYPGYTYWGEYLQRPKHNVLAYERVPNGHIVVFDILTPCGLFESPYALNDLAYYANFEPVQWTRLPVADAIRGAQAGTVFKRSMLGGMVEGVVLKTGERIDEFAYAKVVSQQFHEVKSDRTQRNRNNPDGDIAIGLANKYCTAARFQKAVQRLREAGECTGSMRDIPKLIRLVSDDLHTECGDDMMRELFELYWKRIHKQAVSPVAAWYEQLLTNDNAYWDEVRDQCKSSSAT